METETTTKAQHNKLDLAAQIKLLDWVRANEEKVKTLPDTQLATMAGIEIGFTVTPPNISSVRRAAGIEKLKPATPPTVEERLTYLENVIKELWPLTPRQTELATTFSGPVSGAAIDSLPGLETTSEA